MSTVNKISKDGTVHDIGAIYDGLDNKISEFYATKDDLKHINEQIELIQTQLGTITESISALEERLGNVETSVEDWNNGGSEEGEATELDA